MIVVKEVCACMVTAQALAAMQHVTEVAASTHGALMASLLLQRQHNTRM